MTLELDLIKKTIKGSATAQEIREKGLIKASIESKIMFVDKN